MITAPSVGTEIARNTPLTAGALYINFISQYGATIVTTLAIAYALMQMYLRWKEHRLLLADRKAKEAAA